MEVVFTNAQVIEDSIKTIISQFDNVDREGLKETPARVARMYAEILQPPRMEISVFDADGYDEMIIDNDIKFFSLCEHHLLPFFGTVTIGYVPDMKVIGLSKLSRIVDHFSKQLQMQERLTSQIANFITEKLSPKGVGVIVRARHLCREMRGIKNQGEMITSCLLGVFREDEKARNEFLSFRR